MIEELQKHPQNSLVYAYEGEDVGLVIVKDDENSTQIRLIHCCESDRCKDCKQY